MGKIMNEAYLFEFNFSRFNVAQLPVSLDLFELASCARIGQKGFLLIAPNLELGQNLGLPLFLLFELQVVLCAHKLE